MQGTLVYLTLWVTEQFSGEWMTSFLGFKLKGSSSLELKTDLCMLWNEQSAHSVHGPFYSIKQEEVKNYSDGKNVAPCNSYNYSIPYHHFLTLLDLANASTHIVKKKIKFLSFALTWCQLLQQLLGYAIFEGNCYLMRLLKKKTTGFWMGPFKKGVVFHLELVVILAMWFYHQGALEAFALTHGIKACCGGDRMLWRCLDTMSTQIRAHLSRTSPHTEAFRL